MYIKFDKEYFTASYYYCGDRSRHPDNVPRRGRRMKPPMVSSTRITGSPALMSMANMALCSGAHIRTSQDCVSSGNLVLHFVLFFLI